MIKKSEALPFKVESRTVEVPELERTVELRGFGLSGALRALRPAKPELAVPAMLAETVRDAEGVLLWSVDEWDAWCFKNLTRANELYTIAQEVCGMSEADLEKK